MRKSISAILALSTLICSVSSHAKTVFLTGTVTSVFLGGAGAAAESVNFTMSFVKQNNTGCTNPGPANGQIFAFNTKDIGDAQTRKNLLTLILASKTSGIPLIVDWDDAGTECDAAGYPIPVDIGM